MSSELLDLWDDIRNDPAMQKIRSFAGRLVPGDGADKPKAFVVSGSPSAAQVLSGRVWSGVTGNVLAQLMEIAGLRASESYGKALRRNPNAWVTNAFKYRLQRRMPTEDELAAARNHLRREYALVGRPPLVVAVGEVPAQIFAHTVWGNPITHGELYPLPGNRLICFQHDPVWGMRGDEDVKELAEQQWELMGKRVKEEMK